MRVISQNITSTLSKFWLLQHILHGSL